MLTTEDRAYLATATRNMQIIVGALAGGVLSLFGVVLALGQRQPGLLLDGQLLTYMSVVAAFLGPVAAIIIPGIVLGHHRQTMVAGKPSLQAGSIGGPPLPAADQELAPILASYQTALIIRSAILEGGAFFCLVAYLFERQTPALVAAGILFVFLLVGFPTQSKVEDAVQNERTTIDQLCQMDPNIAR